jgi:2-isopropylmalate synthase
MKLRILDTTLRKGEESAGAAMSASARLGIAKALEAAGIDVIEAGFPAASPRVAASVAQIAEHVTGSAVAAFCRLVPKDVEIAWAAIKHAREPRFITSLATSDDHLNVKLRMTRAAALERIDHIVRMCAAFGAHVSFSAEDATRTDRDFLMNALSTAVSAGARTVVIPDTVGYMHPDEYGALTRFVRERLPDDVALAAHCANDQGLALANSLAAIAAGAGDVHVTVNGIGPRAGICALEELSVALRVRSDYYGVSTRFATERIAEISDMVAIATDLPPAKNKAVVGRNAFAHECGVHQDGVLRQRSLYEIVPAEFVGRASGELRFGRNSGRHGLAARFKTLGFTLAQRQLEMAYLLFLSIANETLSVADGQLLQIAQIAAGIGDESSNATDRPLRGDFIERRERSRPEQHLATDRARPKAQHRR